jgi:methylphosphotriester-DNA--protein-cysteine methyltransferase
MTKRNTQLFFLDEATALSAGHRPCAECRREDYNRFKELWLKGNPEYGFDKKTSIQQIDTVLHRQRFTNNNSKIIYEEKLSSLPDGIFVLFNDHAHLLYKGQLYP